MRAFSCSDICRPPPDDKNFNLPQHIAGRTGLRAARPDAVRKFLRHTGHRTRIRHAPLVPAQPGSERSRPAPSRPGVPELLRPHVRPPSLPNPWNAVIRAPPRCCVGQRPECEAVPTGRVFVRDATLCDASFTHIKPVKPALARP